MAGAYRLAERLCERFRNASLVHNEKTLQLTCSIGVVEADVNLSPEQLTADADAALYAAKEAGRDTIRSKTPPAVSAPDEQDS